MNIVCAASVRSGAEAFSTLGRVTVLPEEDICREHLINADALITRSKAQINESLLRDTSVRFVGCAVAGQDHIDTQYLDQTGIVWSTAPGCNANSVAEYVIAAILIQAERLHLNLDRCTLAIVGVGHIGTRVAVLAETLGMTLLLNDPPRQAVEKGDGLEFLDLEDILPMADFITLHVPYTRTGPCPTHQLIDGRFLELCSPGSVLINMARGEIMDSDAILLALRHGVLQKVVLDVWENEPSIRLDLLQSVDIATPHVAGYSQQGRLNGTCHVYEECCRFFDLAPTWDPEPESDTTHLPEHQIDATGRTSQEVLTELVKLTNPILDDDERLRAGASANPGIMAAHFRACRRNYPDRHEFSRHRISLKGASDSLIDTATALGFIISD